MQPGLLTLIVALCTVICLLILALIWFTDKLVDLRLGALERRISALEQRTGMDDIRRKGLDNVIQN